MSRREILGNRKPFKPRMARDDPEIQKILEWKAPKIPSQEKPAEEQGEINLDSRIDLDRFIRIPDTNLIISAEELYKGEKLAYDDTHFKLNENGLFMPDTSVFMPYFVKVRDAVMRNGKLHFADGKELSREEIGKLWKKLSKNCWSWLNAGFEEDNGKWSIIKTRVENGELKRERKDLECLMEDCYAELEFNEHGMPTTKAKVQEYKQGENIYFYHPRDKRVAGFDAGSGGADLGCNWIPLVAFPALGVFGCAEGTQKNSIQTTSDFWRISGVKYRNKVHTVDLAKSLLDNGSNKTQEDWAEYSEKVKEQEGFYVGDMPLYHALFTTLFRSKDKTGAEEARDFIQKTMRGSCPITLTRIVYQPAGKDKVIHNFGMREKYFCEENIVGPNRIIEQADSAALTALLGTGDVNEIKQVYEWINKTPIWIWRVNSKPKDIDERVAGFGAYSDRAVLGCYGVPRSAYPALGVRAVRRHA